MVEKRINIAETELREIYSHLKSQDYSLRDINSKIDSEFRNYLYKGHTLDKNTFDKLQSLHNKPIEYEEILFIDGKNQVDDTGQLTKNEETAELIGIMLGDGYLSKKPQHSICITLNADESQLIERVEHICKHTMGKNPKMYSLKESHAVQLKIYSKEFVDRLVELGLETGNKVENQVNIPEWIRNKRSYQRKCLRGLVDTDGCIYTQERDNRTIIRFKNRSQPLLTGFKELCRNLEIKPSDGGGKYSVQVASQNEVRKFIGKIDPIKSKKLQEYDTLPS